MLAQTTPTKTYSPSHNHDNLFYPRDHAYLHLRQDQRRGNERGRKAQRLCYSHSTHLPTYGEAVRQGGGAGQGLGVVQRATSLLSRQYAHYLSSYPGLPLYHSPLDLQPHTQAPAGQPSSSPVCQLLACGGGHCGGQRGLLYQDSLYGAYGVYRGPRPGLEAQPGQGVTGRPQESPCLLRSWGRVSSLESEV